MRKGIRNGRARSRILSRRKKKTRIPVSKQNRKKIVTYLDDETYDFFKRYCSEHDMKPSLVVRHLIKECLNKPL